MPELELRFLAEILKKLPEYQKISGPAVLGRAPQEVSGLSQVHKTHLIYSLCAEKNKPALCIAADEAEAARMVSDLNAVFGGGAFLYPQRELTLRPVEGVSREYEHERLSVLGAMLSHRARAVVACADAAMAYTIPPAEYKKRTASLSIKHDFAPRQAEAALLAAGYERADQVEGPGQFAVRGGILDFFPPDSPLPVRVEFWGDRPDSISLFETDTQRRTDPADYALITPASEVLFDSAEDLVSLIDKTLSSLKTKRAAKAALKAAEILQKDRQAAENGIFPSSKDRYLPVCYGGKTATLFDYADGALLFVSELRRVRERVKNTLWQFSQDLEPLLEDGLVCPGMDKFNLEPAELSAEYEKRGAVFLDTFAHSAFETPIALTTAISARQLSVWGGGFRLLVDDLKPHLQHGGSAAVFCGTERACDTLAADLRGEGIRAERIQAGSDEKPPAPGSVLVLPGALSAGFEYPELKFMLLTHGAAGPSRFVSAKKPRHKPGEKIRSLSEITPGDYVVHAAHGIGVYEGIHQLDVHGVIKDYIKIRYAGNDTLYVPVTQLDLVSKYIGPREDGAVRLNKMGGAEWQKTKTRVRSAVKDMAKELIALYASRQSAKGFPFSKDTVWQREFEERFDYDETDGQLRSVQEIKQDMEKPCPMERLLCGDVGFGKTEVALRAAFKCVTDGKQCALLVPTTILAWQHYQTVLRRMENYPIKIELLSRFRTSKQQEEILRKLKRGEVDIIIGTHRLVQKDVLFKDLGLVIIDEEQRFGVAQKERLKQTFKGVDVLTLSATPIPRTLNMALSGIRDMSVLEEAPQDRQPVQTYVLEHNPAVLADAIRRELRRGGQVYYLHNRVESIESAAKRIHTAVPEARIGVAHGKMEEDELSLVWEKLLNDEIDVLCCTTIIETGVDVPNCNTLIIEDADRMGLSQLHQIRGRVGRSSRRAYAFFTFRRGKALSEIATKRLSAIREFTEFGSGFQIALRDLEIRGAGNILGAQQHGHMEAVGYDMYLKLLNEAVLEEKGEAPRRSGECMVDIRVPAHIPEDYIRNQAQRLAIYRRIAGIESPEDASDVIDELIDRFSDPPAPVRSLIDVALIRNTAASLGIDEISQRDETMMLFARRLDPAQISELVRRLNGRVMVNAGQRPYISVKTKDGASPVDTLREALAALSSAAPAAEPAKPAKAAAAPPAPAAEQKSAAPAPKIRNHSIVKDKHAHVKPKKKER